MPLSAVSLLLSIYSLLAGISPQDPQHIDFVLPPGHASIGLRCWLDSVVCLAGAVNKSVSKIKPHSVADLCYKHFQSRTKIKGDAMGELYFISFMRFTVALFVGCSAYGLFVAGI